MSFLTIPSYMKQAAKLVLNPLRRRRAARERHRSIRAAILDMRKQARAAESHEAPAAMSVRHVWRIRELATNGRLAVFAHFDPRGRVHQATKAYLKAICDEGFSIVFVTSSPEFSDMAVDELRPLVCAVLLRSNVGHDFGAWRDGLAFSGDVSTRESVLLINDSVYGPLSDLGDVLARLDGTADVWALTESFEIEKHLQSYFLYFRPPALRSTAFREFWSEFRLVPGRAWAVHHGEMGLSKCLRAQGLRLRALAGYRPVRNKFRQRNRMLQIRETAPNDRGPRGRSETAYFLNDGHAVNPTHYFWRELIEDFGLPFIKRDFVDRNPEGVADVEDARVRVASWLAGL